MRLIDADEIENKAVPMDSYDGFWSGPAIKLSVIHKSPTVDAAPVRHGRWLHRKNGVAYCSKCEIDTVEDETEYCPNCGAKMDGGND